MLRSILMEVTSRVKSMAVYGCTGVAQALYTELSGHGGLPIFRRLDIWWWPDTGYLARH